MDAAVAVAWVAPRNRVTSSPIQAIVTLTTAWTNFKGSRHPATVTATSRLTRAGAVDSGRQGEWGVREPAGRWGLSPARLSKGSFGAPRPLDAILPCERIGTAVRVLHEHAAHFVAAGGRADAAGSLSCGSEEPGRGLRPTHPRLCAERTGCGPPSPLPATLASPDQRSTAFCKSFTFLYVCPCVARGDWSAGRRAGAAGSPSLCVVVRRPTSW